MVAVAVAEKNFARQEREMAIVEDGCQRTTRSLSSFATPVNLFCKEQSVHLSSKLRRTRSHRKLR
jgi:hypothetical protein